MADAPAAGAVLCVHSADRRPVAQASAQRPAPAHRCLAEICDRLPRAARDREEHDAADEPRDESRRHVRAREPAHPEPEGNDRRAVARDAHSAGAGALRGCRARRRGRRTPASAAARREQRRAADRRPHLRHARLRAPRSSGSAHGLSVRRRRAVAGAGARHLSAARAHRERATRGSRDPVDGAAAHGAGAEQPARERAALCTPQRHHRAGARRGIVPHGRRR